MEGLQMKPSQKKATLIALALAMGVVTAQSNAALVVNVNVAPVEARDYFKHNIEAKYQAKTNDQIILPLDIADLPIVQGSLIKDQNALPNLFKSNDKKLTQYLGQNKQAGELFKKYQLRVVALHAGKAPQDLTLEQALNQEALFKFLDSKVTPNTISSEMLQYLEARGLDSTEIGALKSWGKRYTQSPELTDSVSGAIATELNNSYNRK